MLKCESFVSVVIVIDHAISAIEQEIYSIKSLLDSNYTDYEILIVVQGPVQRHVSDAEVNLILNKVPCVRLIQLASDVRHDVARAAGFENAIGDFVVLFNLATDPLPVIPEAVGICRGGSDIVIGVSKRRAPFHYRLVRRIAEWLLGAIDYRIPANSTDFRTVSRRAINAVINAGHFYHQLNLRLQKTGYPSQVVFFDPTQQIAPRRSLRRALRRFVSLLVFNSSRPLRWVSAIGLFGSCVALIFAIYSIVIRLLTTGVVEGWTTTIVFMSLQFMLMFIILAVISEYMSRILDEQRGSTEYSIVSERNSALMINSNRVNVLNESVAVDINRVQTGRNA